MLKLLQNMTEKRLVVRDESERTHVYAPARREQQTKRLLVADLVDRVFDGSAAALVMQVLAGANNSKEEIDEIRKLLDQKRGGRR